MTLDTFFKKFDQFAAAPNAVAKMRELVLELAVQGKLVEPPSKPETDRAWLTFKKEISERICSYDSGPPPPFDIPEHWEWSVLGEVAKPCGQKTPDDDFTYIDVGSIDNARGELKPDLNTIEVTHAPSRARKLARTGSVIYATVRPYLKNIAVIEKEFCPPAIISTAFAILHPLQFVESRYLFYWLRSSAFEREVSAYAKGVAYPAISDGDLKRCVIPVPPPSEQKRIVAKVDELMALCDRLEAQQQERDAQSSALARASLARFAQAPTPANLNLLFHKSYSIAPADLRRSILTLAVQGKLVPQNPKEESAEKLFSRIHSTKENQIKERIIKRASVESNPSAANCDSLPAGWMWTRLGNTFDVRDGTHDTPKYTKEGYPLITSKNIYSGSLLFEGANLISEKDHRQICERSKVDRNDILFAMIGSIGNPVVVDTDREFSIKNVALFKYYAAADAEPRFLLLYLKLVAEEMRAKAAGGVQAFVSLGFLRNYVFPLPPLAEQRRIVAKVDQLMALVDQLETQLAASRATARNLLEAVVAELSDGQPIAQ